MDTKERLRTAVHETLHAMTGMHCGTIHHVTLWPSGETSISFCLQPLLLARHYARTPEKTHRELVAILASLMAPSILMHTPCVGADAALVEEWRVAYAAVPQAEMAWKTVVDEARRAVGAWIAMPGRRELVAKVATALGKCTCVYGDTQWRAFVASCQAPRQAPRRSGSLDFNRLGYGQKQAPVFTCIRERRGSSTWAGDHQR